MYTCCHLPRNLFYTTDISVTLWIINANKKERTFEQNSVTKKHRNREEEILFMDLRQRGVPFEKKYTQFSDEAIEDITNTFHTWQQIKSSYKDEAEFCYSAKIEEVRAKDYSLVPSKYIEFINRDENIDFDEKMKSLQQEFKILLEEEEKSKKDLLAVFEELGYAIK